MRVLLEHRWGSRGPRWPKKGVPKRGDPKVPVGSWGKKLKCNLSRSWEASWDILEASWDYLGAFGIFWASCETAGGAQDDPAGPKKIKKGFQAAPKRPQEMPKRHPRADEKVPGNARNPRDAQEAPKSAQECSRNFRNFPKRVPRVSWAITGVQPGNAYFSNIFF